MATKRITSDPNPVVTHFPRCPECNLAFILRRCYSLSGGKVWLWQRDCKHRKVEPVIEAEHSDGADT